MQVNNMAKLGKSDFRAQLTVLLYLFDSGVEAPEQNIVVWVFRTVEFDHSSMVGL
jgi:hypothetical protein